MARKRNEAERERLLQIAYKLMTEQGFENTSLSDIAKAANITKSLVQYYFPAKEIIATTLIERGLNTIYEQISKDKEINIPNSVVMAFAVGYVLFNYSFYNNVITKFLVQEYIENRLYTMQVVDIGLEWFEEKEPKLFAKLREEDPHFDDKLSFAFGGIIEYVYECNENGREIDGDFIIEFALKTIEPSFKLIVDDDTDLINISMYFPDDWFKKHVKEYNKKMFGI
ncbi:MAG: TetR/AcrR family transcriptional regulator [Clostridia bacterium]|nr:TetR/AcrR family transcriptional regulator [Clostridia bacterium]